MSLKFWCVASTVVAVSSTTLLGLFLYQDRKKESTNNEQRSKLASSPISLNTLEVPEDIYKEQLARNIAFLGEDNVEHIRNATVVIIGAGGVGSWAATMLVRSGVGKLKIVDFDQVTLSSLNRHACATLKDVGTPKVHCVAKFLHSVSPWVTIEPIVSLWTKDQPQSLELLHDATYVIDCIDNINTKVDLLDYCHQNASKYGFKFISSMGAGCKADPTRIRLADISQTAEDPLCRSTRIRLRSRGITTGIPVVFSAEKPGKDKAKLLALEESKVEEGNVDELAVLQDFRVRILPVLGPLPAIFGLTIATHVLTDLGNYKFVYDPVLGGYSMAGKARTKVYQHALENLVGQAARYKWPDVYKDQTTFVPLSVADVGYMIEEVFSGKSITGEPNRLVLTKWDPSKPLVLSNVVPLNKSQLAKHEQELFVNGKTLEEVYPKETLELVEQRLKLHEHYSQFR